MKEDSALNFITIFTNRFDTVHLYKDVGMIPYYLSSTCGWQTSLAYFGDIDRGIYDDEYEQYVRLIPIKNSKYSFIRYFNFIKFMYEISGKYDIVNLYHVSSKTRNIATFLKWLNPGITVYVKCDMDANGLESFSKKLSKSWLRSFFWSKFGKCIDLFSFETKSIAVDAEIISTFRGKSCCIPNGYYEPSWTQALINRSEKEDIILSVGRIGTYQKYNELLINALIKIGEAGLKSWRVLLVGPVEPKFCEFLQKVYIHHEWIKKKVFMVGNVSEKKTLYEYYAKSKVFCLTSRHEGFALVLPEALRFGDYIIMSDIPMANDITDNEQIGRSYINGDMDALVALLLEVLNDKVDLNDKSRLSVELAKDRFDWQVNVKKLAARLGETQKGL